MFKLLSLVVMKLTNEIYTWQLGESMFEVGMSGKI